MTVRKLSLTFLFFILVILIVVASGSAVSRNMKTSVTIIGDSSLDADFTVMPNYENGVNVAKFIDSSRGDPDFWRWYFGDGCNSTSEEQNPVHCFRSSGVYNVSLFIYNNVSSSNVTKEIAFVRTDVSEPAGGSSSHDDWPEEDKGSSESEFNYDEQNNLGGEILKIWSDDLKAYIYGQNSFDYTSGNGTIYSGSPENIFITRLNSDPECLSPDCPYYTFYVKPDYCYFNCYNELTITPGPDEWNYIQSKTNIEGIRWMNPDTGYWEGVKTIINSDNMSVSARVKDFGLYALFLIPKESGKTIRKVMSEIYTEETTASEAVIVVFMVFVLISGLVLILLYDGYRR